jgi:hypothetical protein
MPGYEPKPAAGDPRRIDLRAARNTARHLVEGWALEAARRRKLAEEYRQHLLALRAELASLQRDHSLSEHDCPTCRKAAAGPDIGDVPL